MSNQTNLNYVALEKCPVSQEKIWQLAYRSLLNSPNLFDEFINCYSPAVGSDLLATIGRCRLEVCFQAAEDRIEDFTTGCFDAIYLDAFSPDANSELWTESFLTKLLSCLAKGGCLATYCVNRTLKDRLRQIGFAVDVSPGPAGGKREVMVAQRPGT